MEITYIISHYGKDATIVLNMVDGSHSSWNAEDMLNHYGNSVIIYSERNIEDSAGGYICNFYDVKICPPAKKH